MKTLVQISEKIRDHLTAQKARSLSDNGLCRYRGENGLMCAVGCLITDEVYSNNAGRIESECADNHKVHNALVESLGFEIDEPTERMMCRWQEYHDDYVCTPEIGSQVLSYGRWVRDGDEASSPANIHKLLIEGKFA